MLTEEAHHMFVGDNGLQRVVRRTAELMKQHPAEDVRALGGIDLPTIQRVINFWYSYSLDLFGGEISSNAADFFGSSLKGRYREGDREEHTGLDQVRSVPVVEDGRVTDREVPLRNAMNEVLRDDYVSDCERGIQRWNRELEKAGLSECLSLPSRRFHRHQGQYSGHYFDLDGALIAEEEFERRRDEWLITDADMEYLRDLMTPVTAPGEIANWIAPPSRGIDGNPFEFEYVRL